MRGCIVCGEPASQRCGGCANVSYCSVAHQVIDTTLTISIILKNSFFEEKALADTQACLRTLQDLEEQGITRRDI